MEQPITGGRSPATALMFLTPDTLQNLLRKLYKLIDDALLSFRRKLWEEDNK